LLLNNFFPIVDTFLSGERCSPTNLCDGAQMAIFASFLRPIFPASRLQHISDVHSKFALRPHLVSNMVDIQSAAAEIRRGKKKKIEERNHRAKI